MKIALIAMCLSLLTAVLPAAASAATLNFDDLSAPQLVPSGYGGFDWQNFRVMNPAIANYGGYHNAPVSGANTIFNSGGTPASFTSQDASLFNLSSLYITAAWNEDLQVTLSGLVGGIAKYTMQAVVGTTMPTLLALDWSGIDTMTFSSFGGTNAGYEGLGTHFAIDNITYSPVPGPEAGAGLGALTMVGAVLYIQRRRKQQAIPA